MVHPTFLGAGGGGAVFSYQREQQQRQQREEVEEEEAKIGSVSLTSKHHSSSDRVAVKVSWVGSAASVRNECAVLNFMNEQGPVRGVEQCLACLEYAKDPRRSVIFLEPVVEATATVSSLTDLVSESPQQERATADLMHTAAQMLATGVVTTDVQPLISKETGETLLIDLTEAKILYELQHDDDDGGHSKRLPQRDVTLISAFLTEVTALIPETMWYLASKEFLSELSLLERLTENSGGVWLMRDPGVLDVLMSLPIASNDLLEFLESTYRRVL